MKSLTLKKMQADHLYQLILDNALDAFVAIDSNSNIIDWSMQAEKIFGWGKAEVIGKRLTETIVPAEYHAAHLTGMKNYFQTGQGPVLNRRVELVAQHKDGAKIPIELAVTPIRMADRVIFSASIRDISQRKQLEESVRDQASITTSILNSMANAVVVSDLAEHLLMVNPAAQQLLNLPPAGMYQEQAFRSIPLFEEDKTTPYPADDRPMARALRGEEVSGAVAFIRHERLPQGAWLSINARPLVSVDGAVTGAVVVCHDITELRESEEAWERQALLLQERASLLDLAHDAILVRTVTDIITYWNRSAEKLYRYKREEAIGEYSHQLLAVKFPRPIDEINAIVREKHYWEGELVHTAKNGQQIIVFSQWVLDFQKGRPLRYFETNTDITQRVQTERALKQSQENYRLLIEASTDHAILMMDPLGLILSWNSGAEKIIGYSQSEMIGQHCSIFFTPEDREAGEPWRELDVARAKGRSEDDRWHLRKSESRFWATGVVTPLWNDDGSLRGFVKIMRDQTAQRLVEEQTKFLANHDVLSGLANRVNFSNQLHQAIAVSQRNDIPLAVLLLDLDRFKEVNDTFGHHTGDLLLREVAWRLLSSIRETDFVARLGGDEFAVIQTDIVQPQAAETLAKKLIRELGEPYVLEGNEVFSGTSVGISFYPQDAKNPVELLKKADLALYEAKHSGRHTYHFFTTGLPAEPTWKTEKDEALRNALTKHQFELYYQPQIDLNNWSVSGAEVLLRWQASPLDLILPKDFLSSAEDSGMIVEIGQWALRRACCQLKEWQDEGLPKFRVSMNCSLRQLGDPHFSEMAFSILSECGLPPSCLELEIPESAFVHHPEIWQHLSALRTIGVRITLDNFGIAATALMDLKDFNVDTLKIDQGLVQHLPHRREDSAVTSAMITLAHDLDIKVLASGVETAEQLRYLMGRDCTNAQGFIFSPPVTANKFKELLMYGQWSRVNPSTTFREMNRFKDLH